MSEHSSAAPLPFGSFVILLGALFTFFTPTQPLAHAFSVGFILLLTFNKRAKLLALSLLIGMAFGAVSHWRVQQSRRILLGQSAAITSITVTVAGDGRMDHTGNAVVPVRLVQASSRDTTTQARGPLTLTLTNSPVRLRTGMQLRLVLREALNPTRPFVLVDGDRSEAWQVLGYSHPLWAVRAQFLQKLEPWVTKRLGANAPLLFASLTGDRAGLSITTQALFNKAGMSHLLALSGFHLGLLITALSVVTKPLRHPRRALLVAMPFFIVYLFVSGFSPSLLRAVAMALVTLLILQARRSPTPAQNTLSLAVLALWAVNPHLAYSLSLQLSALAVFGIIFFYAPFTRLFRLPTRFGRFITATLAMAAASQLAITPLVAARFGWVNLFSVVSGVVVIPLYILFVYTALAVLVLPVLNPVLGVVSAVLMRSLFYATWGHAYFARPILTLIVCGLLATLLLLWHNKKPCKK